jgi:hypothetical protein
MNVMSGPIPSSILAEAILIMAWKGLVFAAPFIAVAALWWLVNQTDRVIAYLFPDLEWERNLGWLDIRSERRARTVLRWLGYGIYLLLGAALLGIPWATEGMVEQFADWPDPSVIGNVMLDAGMLAVCLFAWVVFLGAWLIPKLRAQREEAGLKKYRAQMVAEEDEAERERGLHSPSRVKSSLKKPRTNAPRAVPTLLKPEIQGRTRSKRPPGE